ncbi:MAG: leucine-rich repeat domain-containing protein [Treponema sp.]|nr:leucine-rich repeat domain-containing protein [Treponema sp.]
MKNRKLLIPALFAALALAGCVYFQDPEGLHPTYAVGGMTFSYVKVYDGSASIIGYSGIPEVTLPSSIKGLPVGYIDHGGAFAGKGLTSLQLPESLTFIGDSSFSDNKLKKLELPSKIRSIGNRAFANNELEGAELPGALTFIGSRAFYQNALAGKLTIPARVNWLGEMAFSGNRITELAFAPGGVLKTIHAGAFRDNALTEVVIPGRVEEIGSNAFAGNPITSVTIGARVNFTGAPFGNGFEEAYADNDRSAGTYSRASEDSDAWDFSPAL